MQITYNRSTLTLEDIPLDVGYACEKVNLKEPGGESFSVGGQNGTQLIISAPFIDEKLLSQIEETQKLLSLNAMGDISKTLVVSTAGHGDPQLKEWRFGFDEEEEFGDFYGVRLAGGELGGEFAKALFLVSKDGALFYDEVLRNLDGMFSLEKALPKIAAAINCYNGKGCH